MTLGCAAASQAHAQSWFQFEAGLGATHYDSRGDGMWYQAGAPDASESLNAPMYSAGLTGPLLTHGRWGIDWHADYVYMGNAHAQCWCTPVDAYYDVHARRIINTSVPLASYSGSGHIQGLALMVEPYYTLGSARVGLMGGVFAAVPTWNETVLNWSSAPGMTTRGFQVSAKHRITFGPVVGAEITYRQLSIRYQWFKLPTQGIDVPPVWGDAHVVSLVYKF